MRISCRRSSSSSSSSIGNFPLSLSTQQLLSSFSLRSRLTSPSFRIHHQPHHFFALKSTMAAAAPPKPHPIVITGPSGVGKGTLIDRLLKERPDKFGFSVSHTTRQPRSGEIDGKHYHFTSKEQMEKAIAEGKFVESANVHGNFYGTSKQAVECVQNEGKVCILDIDVQGCESVKKSTLKPKYIFVAPPSMEALEKRLRGRGTETEEKIQTRLKNATGEMNYTKRDKFFDKIIVNDNLDTAFKELRAWIDTHCLNESSNKL